MAHYYVKKVETNIRSFSHNRRTDVYDGCLSGGIPHHTDDYDKLVYFLEDKAEFADWLINRSPYKTEHAYIDGDLLVFKIDEIPWNHLMFIKQAIYNARASYGDWDTDEGCLRSFVAQFFYIYYGFSNSAEFTVSSHGDMNMGGSLSKIMTLLKGNHIKPSSRTWSDVMGTEGEWKQYDDSVGCSIEMLDDYELKTLNRPAMGGRYERITGPFVRLSRAHTNNCIVDVILAELAAKRKVAADKRKSFSTALVEAAVARKYISN